jgi:hypothetical protein
MTRSTPRSGDRASSGRPVDITLVLAIALPLVVALALFLTNPGFGTGYFHLPTAQPLTRATVVCPGSVGSGDEVGVAASGSGEVTVGENGSATVPPNGVGVADAAKGPVVISASGATAPGLVATRSSMDPVTAAPCISPRADQWFTGVGAGPTHDSYVELVNPNPGSAIADLTLLGDTGPIDVPDLRGIAVPGHASQVIDLGKVVPTQSALALHAVVERGQVAIAVRDRAAQLVGTGFDEDWLPAEARPSSSSLLLGLASGSGSRQLTVANPGNLEVTASVRLVSANSIYTPDGAPTLDIGPESVRRIDVAKLLQDAGADGALGIQIEASGAVTASLRSVVGGDVSVITRTARMTTASSAVVPVGPKQLVAGAASRVGALTVVTHNAAGKRLSSQRVALSPRQGVSVRLPDAAVRVDVTPDQTAFRGSVMLSASGGTAIVPLQRLQVTSEVPFVKPGLPR